MSPFLGTCPHCPKINLNYRALSSHLRRVGDAPHIQTLNEWLKWRAEYRANLYCKCCGDIFEISDKSEKDRKQCDVCVSLRNSDDKEALEIRRRNKKTDTRYHDKNQNSKASMTPGYFPREWSKPEQFSAVIDGFRSGLGPASLWKKTGVPLSRVYDMLYAEFGAENVKKEIAQIKKTVVARNREKARLGSGLEELFFSQLVSNGFHVSGRNCWSTISVSGEKAHREIDLKVSYASSKILIFCDGEAYHGPKAVYSDRREDDRETARAFHALGYSVVRYSESEIHSSAAIKHFKTWVEKIGADSPGFRIWDPQEEFYGGRGG